MSKKYPICHQDKKSCPFKTLDMQLDIFICNFHKEYWRLFNDGNSFGAKNLLNRACEWIQEEKKRQKFISKSASKQTIKMLKNIEVGDMLFWVTRSEDVRLFESPSEFSQIVRCKCQRDNGNVIKIPAYLLRKVSKGDYYGEFFIEGTENEKKAQQFEYKAKYYGFRAEIERKDNGFLLKIYGDSQQEIDEFINVVLKQGFELII